MGDHIGGMQPLASDGQAQGSLPMRESREDGGAGIVATSGSSGDAGGAAPPPSLAQVLASLRVVTAAVTAHAASQNASPGWQPLPYAQTAGSGGLFSPITPAQPQPSILADGALQLAAPGTFQPVQWALPPMPVPLGTPSTTGGHSAPLPSLQVPWAALGLPTPDGLPSGLQLYPGSLPDLPDGLQLPLWSAEDVLPATLGHGGLPLPPPLPGGALPPLPEGEAEEEGQLAARQGWRAPRRKRARIMREGQLTMILYGANEALTWTRRVASFQHTMRGVLGDRRLTFNWGGSVMDSVIGVFLTQNVADHLSSRAYMELASRFPAPRRRQQLAAAAGGAAADGAHHDWTGCDDTVDWEAVRCAPASEISDAIKCRGMQHKLSEHIIKFLNRIRQDNLVRLRKQRRAAAAKREAAAQEAATQREAAARVDAAAVGAVVDTMLDSLAAVDVFEGGAGAAAAVPLPPARAGSPARRHISLEYEERQQLPAGAHPPAACAAGGAGPGEDEAGGQEEEREPTAAELLQLEWLREAPDDVARSYLMNIDGLGRKSVGCIMLLTLGKKEFPVDTNVGRICARLGWIPLESEQAVEDLEEYAPEPEVHAYLHSRLLGFDFETLYELHYQMITLGKVFCNKQQPNCKACPLSEQCEYAQNNGPSLHGRKRVRQPAPEFGDGMAPPLLPSDDLRRFFAGGGSPDDGAGGEPGTHSDSASGGSSSGESSDEEGEEGGEGSGDEAPLGPPLLTRRQAGKAAGRAALRALRGGSGGEEEDEEGLPPNPTLRQVFAVAMAEARARGQKLHWRTLERLTRMHEEELRAGLAAQALDLGALAAATPRRPRTPGLRRPATRFDRVRRLKRSRELQQLLAAAGEEEVERLYEMGASGTLYRTQHGGGRIVATGGPPPPGATLAVGTAGWLAPSAVAMPPPAAPAGVEAAAGGRERVEGMEVDGEAEGRGSGGSGGNGGSSRQRSPSPKPGTRSAGCDAVAPGECPSMGLAGEEGEKASAAARPGADSGPASPQASRQPAAGAAVTANEGACEAVGKVPIDGSENAAVEEGSPSVGTVATPEKAADAARAAAFQSSPSDSSVEAAVPAQATAPAIAGPPWQAAAAAPQAAAQVPLAAALAGLLGRGVDVQQLLLGLAAQQGLATVPLPAADQPGAQPGGAAAWPGPGVVPVAEVGGAATALAQDSGMAGGATAEEEEEGEGQEEEAAKVRAGQQQGREEEREAAAEEAELRAGGAAADAAAECERLSARGHELAVAQRALLVAEGRPGTDLTPHKFRLVELSLATLDLEATMSAESAAATLAAAKRVYRRLSILVHPDRCAHAAAQDAFAAVSQAMHVLVERGQELGEGQAGGPPGDRSDSGTELEGGEDGGGGGEGCTALTPYQDAEELLQRGVWNHNRLAVQAAVVPPEELLARGLLHAGYQQQYARGSSLAGEPLLFLPMAAIPTLKKEKKRRLLTPAAFPAVRRMAAASPAAAPPDAPQPGSPAPETAAAGTTPAGDAGGSAAATNAAVVPPFGGLALAGQPAGEAAEPPAAPGSPAQLRAPSQAPDGAPGSRVHGQEGRGQGVAAAAAAEEEEEEEMVGGLLLVSARSALSGRFPLNGTYFQVNEVFADEGSTEAPIQLPRSLLDACPASAVHFGHSIHFMCKGMSQAEVAHMFAHGSVCFRAFRADTGAPILLPNFLLPSIPTKSSTPWKNKEQRAAAKAAKDARVRGLPPPPPPMPPPHARWLRVPAEGEALAPLPAVLPAGEAERQPCCLEEYHPDDEGLARQMVRLAELDSPAKRRWEGGVGVGGKKARPWDGDVGGAVPHSQEARDAKSGKGRRRLFLHPIVRTRDRCGKCSACLNLHWKKACITRRAEQEVAGP